MSILSLAKITRKHIEKFAKSKKVMCVGDSGNLMGFCGIASYCLFEANKKLKFGTVDFVAGIYGYYPPEKKHLLMEEAGLNHCWNVYKTQKNSYVIDLTATQFEYEEKVIKFNVKDYENFKYYNEILTNKKAFKEVEEWDCQSPFYHQKKLNTVINNIVKEHKKKK